MSSQWAPKWTSTELEILQRSINAMPYAKIATLLPGRTVDAIKRRADMVGFSRSGKRFARRSLCEDFFSTPTLLSSYWAGFIAADGCIITKPRTEVRIGIHQKDINHLRQFAHDAGYDGPINMRGKKRDICDLTICAAYRWVEDLSRQFNIGPRKTFTLKPPLLSGDLALAYSIGYIDGDGCWATQTKYLMLVVVGTQEVLRWMLETWRDAGADIGHVNLHLIRNCWRFTISASKADSVARILLPFNLPKLERKWRIARREYTHQEAR